MPLTPGPTHARRPLHPALCWKRDGPGRAARAIERTWRTSAASRTGAGLPASLQGDALPVARLKEFLRLHSPRRTRTPARAFLAQAEAALDAQLWGEARRHLEQALRRTAAALCRDAGEGGKAERRQGPSARSPAQVPRRGLGRLIARLEEEARDDRQQPHEWRDRTPPAFPDPSWVCANCGGDSLEWRSLCPHCGSFDALAWRTPAHASVAEPPPSRLALPGEPTKIAAAPR